MDDRNGMSALVPNLEPDSGMAQGGGVSTMDLFIALFLILLCFFVVMNSISNKELVRAHAAVKSVKTSFKNGPAVKPAVPNAVSGYRQNSPSDQYFQELLGVVGSMTDFSGRYPVRDGEVVDAIIPADTLFVKGQTRIRFDQGNFLDNLARLLKNPASDEDRMLEIVVSEAMPPAGSASAWHDIGVLRAADLAEELDKRGVPSRLIIAGVATAATGSVKLTFSVKRHDAALLPVPAGGGAAYEP